jgi:DNA-directed RNA polymerase subunit RPC12/RpoP
MSQGASKSFICPHCSKRFQWTTRIADRKAQCPSCHKRIRIPTVPGRVAEAVDPLPESHKHKPKPQSDTYDLDLTGVDESIVEAPPTPAQQAAAETGRCPACNQSINPGAVICVKCGYNLKKGKRLQTAVADEDSPQATAALPKALANSALANISGTSAIAQALENREDEYKPNKIVDLWIPIGMILLGLFATFAGCWLVQDYLPFEDKFDWRLYALISYPIQLFIMVPILLIAATMTVRTLSTSFGPLGPGMLKLTAITMGPMAIADILAAVLVPAAIAIALQGIIAAIGMFFAFYIIFSAPFLFMMFDLEYMDIMFTAVANIILRMISMATVGVVIYMLMQ